MKEEGKENDLIERICADSSFMLTREEVDAILKPENFIGRSVEQVEEYIAGCIQPVLDKNRSVLGESAELTV